MKKNQEGSTLAFCIIMACMLAIFVVGMGTLLTMSRKQKITEYTEEISFYLTDSCVTVTEAKLHDKAAEAIFNALTEANEQVPVTYRGADGSTKVFDKETFTWLYIKQVMQIFSANMSNDVNDVFARDMVQFIADTTDPDYDTDPISSTMLTAALAQPGSTTEGYSITSEIEENTFYGNFSSVYSTCHPSRIDTGERTYITDSFGIEHENPNDEFYPGTPLSDSEIAELEDNLNAGLLRVVYTIYDKEGNAREKVRVAYSFDMYHPIINISKSQADRIYPEISDAAEDGEEVVPETSVTLDLDLQIEATREYLVI